MAHVWSRALAIWLGVLLAVSWPGASRGVAEESLPATTVVGNRLAYLDEATDPYYVHRGFARLTTPQWVGEPGVRAVVVLAIDDMRDPKVYESYLRPILERLKRYQGRASLSIMTNSVDPGNEQLQAWLREGLSLEVHTADHPCPLLQQGDFARARSTYERCIDQLATVPGNAPVAFRMPCCDSMNSPSPRFYEAIFAGRTAAGNFLAIDSSVFNITTPDDNRLSPGVARDAGGAPRFEKYVQFSSYVNTIRDYPYPYVIGRVCWEFPCVVPSDWEGQNLHRPFNPRTIEDMKAALDAAVEKEGVYNLVFHPHGWMRNDQVIELIDHAEQRYPGQVRFLTFREALQRINQNALGGSPLRDVHGGDNGNTLVDLDHDGHLDVVRKAGPDRLVTRRWDASAGRWEVAEQALPARELRWGVVRSDGRASLLAVDGTNRLLWHHEPAGWRSEPLSVDWEGISGAWRDRWLDPAARLVYRLRDLDSDGLGELLVDDGNESLVLRRAADGRWRAWAGGLPDGVRLARADGGDPGLRWADLDGDGRDEILWSTPQRAAVFQLEGQPLAWRTRWNHARSVVAEGEAATDAVMRPFVRADGTNNGAWFHSGHLWFQNEDTARLPDKVDRVPYRRLLDPQATTNAKAEAADGAEGGAASSAGAAAAGQKPAAELQDTGPLEPEQALAAFRSSLPVRVELVAAEPLVVDPVAFDWAPDGRLFVAEMRDYPTLEEGATPRGRVKLLSDRDGDGRYDHAEIFLDEVPFPNGVKAWRGGVLVTSVPNILYAEDTDGDGRADRRTVLFEGFGAGNPQHRVNGLCWGMDGWLYVANGDSGGGVRSVLRDETLDLGGRDLRIRPDDGRMELLTGQTQFGRVRDDEGNWFGCNNSEPLWHFLLEDRYLARNPRYAAEHVRRLVPEQPGAAPVFPASRTLPRFNDFDRANRVTSACGPAVARGLGFATGDSLESYVCEPVHNLVHREILAVDGVSFRSRRAREDAAAEFLASTDHWFRPVMVQPAPDGSLWIADMYRQVIEHPEWIPRVEQARMNLRAGEDRGRIYRVVPQTGAPTRAVPRLDRLSPAELVEQLRSPHRWLRDMAHQRLLWSDDRSVADALRRLVDAEDALPAGRVHAIYLLAEWSLLDDEQLARVLRTAEPVVARQAVILAESRLEASEAVRRAMQSRVADPDASLRLQLALSWGQQPAVAGVGELLATLALDERTTAEIQDAVLTSLQDANIAEVLRAVGESDRAALHRPWLGKLLEQVLARDDGPVPSSPVPQATLHGEALAWVARLPGLAGAWRWNTLADGLDAHANAHGQGHALPGELVRWLREPLQEALAAARDEGLAEADREAALRLLRPGLGEDALVRETLAAMLDPRQPPAVVEAAAAAWIRGFPDESVARLLEAWGSFSPRLQLEVLDEFLERRELTRQLLVEARQRSLTLPLDARRRQMLLGNPHPEVRELAEALLQRDPLSSRDAVLARYQQEMPASGDAERGRAVFQRSCAVCHQFEEMGHAVGPALAALENRSRENLLVAILDPNRAVESTYRDYQVETSDGLALSGILVEDTSVSLALLGPEARRVAVLRQQVERVQATERSLMPEGLERELSLQQMADLIAFLQSRQAQPKSFPGNRPELVPLWNDGSMRLLAMHAEIYGPSLVYEEANTNLGFWASGQDYAAWTVESPEEGDYTVTLHYACPEDSAGNQYAIVCGDQRLTGQVESTGTWENYRWTRTGTLHLPAGRSRIVLRSSGPVQGYLMDMHTLLLQPKN